MVKQHLQTVALHIVPVIDVWFLLQKAHGELCMGYLALMYIAAIFAGSQIDQIDTEYGIADHHRSIGVNRLTLRGIIAILVLIAVYGLSVYLDDRTQAGFVELVSFPILGLIGLILVLLCVANMWQFSKLEQS